MIKKSFSVGLFFLLSCGLFSQENIISDSLNINLAKEIKDTVDTDFDFPDLESVDGKSLTDYELSQRIDSIWQAELTNSDLYPKIRESVLEIPYNTDEVSPSDYQELSTEVLKERLAALNEQTPFEITYNVELENTIRNYLKRNKKSMERLMSLSLYYFPLFEAEFDKYDIPLELKYLAIVESALNPRAKSPVGATGLWQFMFATGKMHGLTVSSYVDERMDPEKSTAAAAEYLSELYNIFGDWNLVLASYNSGPGNVSRAIRRSGGETDYWKMKGFLPRETANYVPAFIATLYLFEYAEQHGFDPYLPDVVHFETDTVKVKQHLKFEHIAEVTGVDEDLLIFLNPSYKLNRIPKVEDKTYTLRLPVKEAGVFVANEKEIYEESKELLAQENPPRYEIMQQRTNYRVQSGDYLGKIANKFKVSVTQIKKWNRLNTNNIRAGQNLVIYPREPQIASSSKSSVQNKSGNTSSQKYYTVKSGDSIWSISKKLNGVSVNQIKKWNGISGNHLKPGMQLKISES